MPLVTTEEIYATSTSGMDPSGPASTSTAVTSFPPYRQTGNARGKSHRDASTGCHPPECKGPAARRSTRPLPSLRYVPGPKGASLVFIRPDDNQLDTPGRQSRGASAADVVSFVDFAHYADRSHTVDLRGSYHAARATSKDREASTAPRSPGWPCAESNLSCVRCALGNQVDLTPDRCPRVPLPSQRESNSSGLHPARKSRSKSRSLSRRKSSRSADPNTLNSAIFHRRQNSSSRSVGMGISDRMASFPHQFATSALAAGDESSVLRLGLAA